MLETDGLMKILESFAPLELSRKSVENGDYDNSGIIIGGDRAVNRILFSLDLSEAAVKRAAGLKCDTVVTHHPAIYLPVKSLSLSDGTTAPVLRAANARMNVISMHLNLDLATEGTDACLAEALGAQDYKILDYIDDRHGYGREFTVRKTTFGEFVRRAKKALFTSRVLAYGKKSDEINKCASFAGAGSSLALKAVACGRTDAQVIITSDMPHHALRELIEAGKKVLLITHYAAENYGFEKFYEIASEKIGSRAQTYYFRDKRFM